MGGTGTLAWAREAPHLFAAVSPAGFRLTGPIGSVDTLADLPIWLAVGSDDGVRPNDVLSVYHALKEAGNKRVGFTAFPGANHAQANAALFSSADLIEWLLSHDKKNERKTAKH
jgi:predicted peptidase